MSAKVAISKCRVRGEQFWRVRWHDAGKVKRKFHASLKSAETHASQLRNEAVGAKHLLASLPQSEQEKLVMVFNEARRRGVDILYLLNPAAVEIKSSLALGDVIKELITVKTKAGRDVAYMNQLRWVLEEFAAGLEVLPINKIGLAHAEKYLDKKTLLSRSNFRTRLSTLFNFAVRRGYMETNPCTRLEEVTVARPHPHIMTVVETQKALAWLRKNPKIFGWFVLSTFAGLRPDEAAKTTWSQISFEEGWIQVQAQTTKVRQRRVVYPKPMVMDWLQAVKASGRPLPVRRNIRVAQLKRLRAVLGWEVWKKDVTRHSCASYWLAQGETAAKVADALGHSERVMRKNYMALVTKVEAEKFWALRP